MSEKFCLKWNDFHSNVSKSFGLFRNEEYLQDVTLVSDDHNKVPAHKLVLSACSEYFRDIFINIQNSHPLICLDGISSEDLKNIMDYIYNGEIQIYQDNLDRFLAVAQRLKLEGLISRDTKTEDLLKEETSTDNVSRIEESNCERKNTTNFQVAHNKIKETEDKVVVAVDSQDMKEINEKINGYLEECFDGSYRCTFCGRQSGLNMHKSVQKQMMQRHIETHMDGLTYTCPICQKTFRSKRSFKIIVIVINLNNINKYFLSDPGIL